MAIDKLAHRCASSIGRVNVQAWPAQPFSDLLRRFRSALELRPQGYDQRPVAVTDVPPCTLPVLRARRFGQHVAGGNRAILGAAAGWTPATVRDAVRDRPIERCAVGTGLPARYDLFELESDCLSTARGTCMPAALRIILHGSALLGRQTALGFLPRAARSLAPRYSPGYTSFVASSLQIRPSLLDRAGGEVVRPSGGDNADHYDYAGLPQRVCLGQGC